jgi:hypothetical protein
MDFADGPPSGASQQSVRDAAVARMVTRLSSQYVLRAFQLLIDNFGDVRAGLLAQAIHTANTAHLDPRTEQGRRVAGPDGVLPDELRRPVSIARLADSSGLPFESARRIVQSLIDGGHCARSEHGMIVPASRLRLPQQAAMVIAQLGYVRRFVRDLSAAGVVDDAAAAWTLVRGDGDEGALARSVARLTAEYFLRALQLLTDTYGDIRSGLVAQTIVIANTAHLDARLGRGRRYAALDDPPPDEVRTPISIARLAESLSAPYETMRGQVQRLIHAGVCARVDGGLIVPGSVLEQPPALRAMLANAAYVRKLVRDLQVFAAKQSADERPDETP